MPDMHPKSPKATWPPPATVRQLTRAELRRLDTDSLNRAREGLALVSVMAGLSDDDIIKGRS